MCELSFGQVDQYDGDSIDVADTDSWYARIGDVDGCAPLTLYIAPLLAIDDEAGKPASGQDADDRVPDFVDEGGTQANPPPRRTPTKDRGHHQHHREPGGVQRDGTGDRHQPLADCRAPGHARRPYAGFLCESTLGASALAASALAASVPSTSVGSES